MIYLKLYTLFFKIGLFSFGGGLSMLPLIEDELTSRGWLTHLEFLNLVSVAQMTPGAIAVNSATYAGNKIAGIGGGVFATLGVITPSIIVITLLATVVMAYKDSIQKKVFFFGIRPVTVALIGFAGYSIGESTFVMNNKISILALLITGCSYYLLAKTKLHFLCILAVGGTIGYFFL